MCRETFANRKKVFLVENTLESGGAEWQGCMAASALAERGVSVKVISLARDGVVGRALRERGIPYAVLGMKKTPIKAVKGILSFALMVEREKPDILIGMLFHSNIFIRLHRLLSIVCRLHRPAVISVGASVKEGGPLNDMIYRMTAALNDRMYQNSRAGLHRYKRLLMDRPSKMGYVPNIPRFFCREDGLKGRRTKRGCEFRWLYVGRLERVKGADLLIPAFSRLIRETKKSQTLTVVGGGSLLDRLLRDAEKEGVSQYVHLTGEVPDPRDYYLSADALVLPSRQEGTPNVLIEAQAYSLPAVCADVGDCSVVVKDGVNGFLAVPESVDSLVEGMKKLLFLSEAEREKMGREARLAVQKLFRDAVSAWEQLVCI